MNMTKVALGCSLRTELTEPVAQARQREPPVLVGPGPWLITKVTEVLHWEGKHEGMGSFKWGTRPGCLQSLN